MNKKDADLAGQMSMISQLQQVQEVALSHHSFHTAGFSKLWGIKK